MFFMGNLEEAERNLLKARDLAERINWIAISAWAHVFLAQTYFNLGEYEKSKNHYKKAIFSIERGRFLPSSILLYRAGVARTKAMSKEKDIALESLFSDVSKNKLKMNDGLMRRYIGEILLNIDDQHTNEAENWIKKAIEADSRNDMRWHLGRDYALCAELFRRKGDQSDAKKNLNKAIEIMRECSADGWVEKYEKELAALT